MKKFNPAITSKSQIVSDTVEHLSLDFSLKRKEQFNALAILLLNLYYDNELLVPRAKCSGTLAPDTILGGIMSSHNEVFNGKTTTYIYNRVQA